MIRTIQMCAFASLVACGHVTPHGDDDGGGGSGSDPGGGDGGGDDDGGNGTPAKIEVSPSSLDFGDVSIVSPPAAQMLTITNTGGSTASPGFAFSGIDAASFQIGAVTCGAEIPPGGSCTIEVALALTHDGAYEASIDVSGGDAQASAGLAATSLAAKLSVSPLNDSFGDVALAASVTHQYTLTNTGDAPLPMPALQISGGAAYTIVSTTCPTTLDAAASCVFGVRFLPSALGTQTAMASVTIGPLTATTMLSGRGTATLSASKIGSGGGTVTGGGLSCGSGAGCFATVASTPITVTASAAAGSVFSGWGGAATGCGTNASCSVPITTAAVNVVANFTDLPTLTVDVNEAFDVDGFVTVDNPPATCTDNCTFDYPTTTVVRLSVHFNPGACEQFDGWSGACLGQNGTICTLTVSGNMFASAGFSIDPTCDPN